MVVVQFQTATRAGSLDQECYDGTHVMFWEEEQPRRDSQGRRWHFQIWMDYWTENERVLCGQRLFFWNDDKSDCGVILVEPAKATHASRLRNRINKLLSDPELRRQHKRDLRFPLERYYREYGAFTEEQTEPLAGR